MKVILLQNIKGVGRIGDVKNVADGYGRNYLLTNKLAKTATDGTMKEAEFLKKKGEVEDKIAVEKAKEIAEKAKDIVLGFTKKSSKTGTLFASLTKEEVAEELSKAIGGKVEPDSIDFKEHGEHIKQEGEHLIEVELAPEIKVEIKVVVKGE
ncbi:MAG: 50S ribosomal protein L9 [bacterium]|nr:50S ribosomal protein L9 [bacterium]